MDFIAIHFKQNNRYHVARLREKLLDRTTIEFAPSSPNHADPNNTSI
ncbi:hypothetical protein [Sporosarcina sp. NPDC096371]